MAELANTSAMITRVTDRFGLNDSGARARVLGWMQTAYEEVYGMSMWWWLQAEEDLVWTPGTRDYTSEASADVVQIAYASGVPLDYYPPDDFRRMFSGHLAIADTPNAWTGRPLEGGLFAYQVWPTPSSADPYAITTHRLPGALADSVASVPLLPLPWRSYLIYSAEMQASQFDQQHGTYEQFLARRDEVLRALEAEDRRRPKVMR